MTDATARLDQTSRRQLGKISTKLLDKRAARSPRNLKEFTENDQKHVRTLSSARDQSLANINRENNDEIQES